MKSNSLLNGNAHEQELAEAVTFLLLLAVGAFCLGGVMAWALQWAIRIIVPDAWLWWLVNACGGIAGVVSVGLLTGLALMVGAWRDAGKDDDAIFSLFVLVAALCFAAGLTWIVNMFMPFAALHWLQLTFGVDWAFILAFALGGTPGAAGTILDWLEGQRELRSEASEGA